MSRLSPQSLPQIAALPTYDRVARRTGIVHVGLGTFARAHLAWYTDRAMEHIGGDWMIAGVSLRSPEVANQLNPQCGLYTLVEKSDAGTSQRVIGSVAEVLVATRQRASISIQLIAPTTHIVTFTVTEKGYCRRADGSLDPDAAENGFYPLLADAFAQRKVSGINGLTLISCDNLADNGHQLGRLIREYLAARAPDLVAWFDNECRCPCSMVDRITPATTADDRREVEAVLGLRDEGVVITEPFSQWVIEDTFAGPRPAWEHVGAQIVADVAPYETAKLRILNGAHSALAYLGLRAGYSYVHEAIADPALRTLILHLMLNEAAPTITPVPGLDLVGYAHALIDRFKNPALGHRLIQIAMDGSQKIPQRWLTTLAANQKAGRDCPAILAAVGAWLAHVRGDNATRWGKVDDPRAEELAQAWGPYRKSGVVAALFGAGGLLASDWRPTADDQAVILGHLVPPGQSA